METASLSLIFLYFLRQWLECMGVALMELRIGVHSESQRTMERQKHTMYDDENRVNIYNSSTAHGAMNSMTDRRLRSGQK